MSHFPRRTSGALAGGKGISRQESCCNQNLGGLLSESVIRVEFRIDAEERWSTKSKRNTKEVVPDQASTALSPKCRARVLPHQHGNLRRLEPRQKIAVQVRVPAELTPARLTHVIPAGVL